MFNFWKASPNDNKDAPEAAVNSVEAPTTPAAVVSDPAPRIPEESSEESTQKTIEPPAAVGKVLDSAGNPLPLVEGSESVMAFPRPSTSTEVYVSEVQMVPPTVSGVDITGAALLDLPSSQPARRRRISFRSFGFFYGKERAAPSTIIQADTEEAAATEAPPRKKIKSKREARKAEKAALVLQSFLLGYTPSFPSLLPVTATSSQGSSNGKPAKAKPKVDAQSKPPNASKLGKANNQLLSPDSANQVIAKLRTLPVPNGPELPGVEYAGEHVVSHAEGPIHAVCLDCTEEEAEKYHFSQLAAGPEFSVGQPNGLEPMLPSDQPSIASANLSSLVPVLRRLRIVTLVASPDLGFGQPPDSPGPLAGSVPSPGAVGTGMMEITSQLLALGFATSNAVFPDHAGVYPPTDRFSVLTYWWGMEVCLPPPTLTYLANAKSIQNAALNLLTAVSLFNNGVREILPFVRYISQFLDFQWGAIQGQNKGKGVVCAATWVCPAALVPRPWDFLDPPQPMVIPKAVPPEANEPTLVFPGSKGDPLFTRSNASVPPIMITPATLPRGAKMEMLRT